MLRVRQALGPAGAPCAPVANLESIHDEVYFEETGFEKVFEIAFETVFELAFKAANYNVKLSLAQVSVP